MNKTAFLFPGQGAQKSGMGKDFYENSRTAREIFHMASLETGIDMKSLCFEENPELNLTEYTQAAMVTTCLAMAEVVKEKGFYPTVTAGLSLGEYCAISFAGGMTKREAVRLVRQRGIYMQNCVPPGEGSMSAVFGMDREEIKKITETIPEVFVANDNCPGQVVITGNAKAVQQAGELLKQQGARRIVPLQVSGPFHSPYMKPAGEKLEKLLEKVAWTPLKIPYVTNVTGTYVYDIEEASVLLKQQVSSPVEWKKSVVEMIDQGIDTFVEIGPGKTLTGFVKKINPRVNLYNIQTWKDLEKLESR